MTDIENFDEAISDSRVVFMGNLPFSTDDTWILSLARPYDSAAKMKIFTDPQTGQVKGYGFLTFSNRMAAARFVDAYQEISATGQPTSSTETLETFEITPSLISASRRLRSNLVDYFALHPEEMRTMDRKLFEELVAEIFRRLDFEVELTAKPGDGGIDVVAIRRAETNDRYIIQCKRPSIGKLVTVEPVRELLGVLTDSGATKGIIATTVYFTSPARQLLDRHQWRLEGRDYDGLLDWLDRASASRSIVSTSSRQNQTGTTRQLQAIRPPRPPLKIDGRLIVISFARSWSERPPRRAGDRAPEYPDRAPRDDRY